MRNERRSDREEGQYKGVFDHESMSIGLRSPTKQSSDTKIVSTALQRDSGQCNGTIKAGRNQPVMEGND